MSPLATAGIAFAGVSGGAALGMLLRAIVPAHHLTEDARDVLKLGMALIGTMVALVLGLLIATAKGSYDTRAVEVVQASADIMLMDGLLARYGPETGEARDVLRRSVAGTIERLWAGSRSGSSRVEPAVTPEAFYDKLQQLSPQTERQRLLYTQAVNVGLSLTRNRWLLAGQRDLSVPVAFLVMLVLWLAVIFGGWGLLARPNPTTVVTLLVCALSFASAILLIMELTDPFQGLVQLSSTPMRETLARLGR